MASKKKPSAKQLAARAKFKKIMQSGGFKKKRNAPKKSTRKAPKRTKSTPKRRNQQPLRRKAPKKKAVAKRRAAPKKKGLLGNIPIINNPTFKKAAAGVGTATIGAAVLSLVAPSLAQNPIVKPVLALAGGDIIGLAAQVFSQGGLGSLGLGNGNGNGNGGGAGFA